MSTLNATSSTALSAGNYPAESLAIPFDESVAVVPSEADLIAFLAALPQAQRSQFIDTVMAGIDELPLPPMELARVRESIQYSLQAANPETSASPVTLPPREVKSPFYYIGEHLPEFFSDWGDDLYDEMVEQKGISMLLGETSRWSGHASSALLTTAATIPVTAPVTAEAGALLGAHR